MDPSRPHSVSTIRVRYGETDQMGVAYHAHYLAWCEVGRTDLMRKAGPGYAQLESDGIRLAVAEATLRYRAPARYDDIVHIETRVERVQSRGVTFTYRLRRDEDGLAGPLLANATTALIAIDTAGRTRRLPDGVRRALGSFEG